MSSLRTAIYLDFKASGQSDIKRAISGAVSETRRAAQEARKARDADIAATRAKVAAERKAAKEIAAAEKLARKQQEASAKAATKTAAEQARARAAAERASLKAQVDATKAAEKLKRDESKRTSQEARQLAQAEARWRANIARDNRRAQAQAQRQVQQRQRESRQRQDRDDVTLGNVGLGAVGVGTALVGAGMAYGAENLQRSRQWIGLDDEDAILGRYGPTHLGAMTTATAGGRDVSVIEGLMARAGRGYGVSPDVSEDLLANIQDSFTDQMGSVIEHWETINQMSAAYGADLRGVARSGAIVQRDLGVSQDEFDDALAVLAGSTTTGAINVGELSTQFGTTPNLLRQAFGDRVTGIQGAETFATMAQISGRSGLEGPERATALDRFLQELNDPETWKRLREQTNGRVRITEGEGANERLRDPRAVMEALMSPEFNRAGVIGEVFQSVPARQFLAGHRNAGMGYYDQLMSESTPEAGRALMAQQMAARSRDPAYLARLDQGRQATTVYQQGGRLLERARSQTGYISDWRAANVGSPLAGSIDVPFLGEVSLASAASAAEGIGGLLDTMYGGGEGAYTRALGRGRTTEQQTGMGARLDAFFDPRIGFRSLLGGDVSRLSPSLEGNGLRIGESDAGASMNALVSDIIRQATGGAGASGPSDEATLIREQTAALTRSQSESASRIENAIGRITPAAPTGTTTAPSH